MWGQHDPWQGGDVAIREKGARRRLPAGLQRIYLEGSILFLVEGLKVGDGPAQVSLEEWGRGREPLGHEEHAEKVE